MTEEEVVKGLFKGPFKWIEKALLSKRSAIRQNGSFAIENAALDPTAADSVSHIQGLIQQNHTNQQITEYILGVLHFVPAAKPIAGALISEASRLLKRETRLSNERVDELRPEVMRRITHNMNSSETLISIGREPLREIEIKVLDAVLAYLRGEFLNSEDLWSALREHEDTFVVASAATLHARELSRQGKARDALAVLSRPNIAKPDSDAFASVAMRLNLELQAFEISSATSVQRMQNHLEMADVVLRAGLADSPDTIAQIDLAWIDENAERLQRLYGLGAVYMVFNALVVRALRQTGDEANCLQAASGIAQYVGNLHRKSRLTVIPDAKTALRMTSIVAIAADHLANVGTWAGAELVRNFHLSALLLNDIGHFEAPDDLRAALKPDQYIMDPALQCASLIPAELYVHGILPPDLRQALPTILTNLRRMRSYRNGGHLMITAFARSCDFSLEKVDGVQRSPAPEIVPGYDFRLYASRRISD